MPESVSKLEQAQSEDAAARVPATPLPCRFAEIADDEQAICFESTDKTEFTQLAIATRWPQAKQDAAYIVHACNNYPRLVEALHEALETLEDYSDVRDGDDGRPSPNKAMSAATEIQCLLDKLGEL